MYLSSTACIFMSYMSTLTTANVIKMFLGQKGNCKHVNRKKIANWLENDTKMGNKCRGFTLLLLLLDYRAPEIPTA